ncbi:hypothetical protein [Mycobacterium sp. M23085]
MDDDSQNLLQHVNEYAATVDDANRQTLNPLLVELMAASRR